MAYPLFRPRTNHTYISSKAKPISLYSPVKSHCIDLKEIGPATGPVRLSADIYTNQNHHYEINNYNGVFGCRLYYLISEILF